MYRAHPTRPRTEGTSSLVVVAVGVLALVASAVTVVGSDALWLPAMGNRIREGGGIPTGIPYAAATSDHWVNTTVMGQLVLSWANEAGSLGLVMAQVVAAVGSVTLVAAEATWRGARPVPTALVVAAVSVGAAAPFFIARAQLLSLVPFSVLLVLLRRQHDNPTRALWWAIPLIALWSNFHGAVLVGVAVLGCYLSCSRLRREPVTAVVVAVGSLLATCLNAGLLRAPSYYVGVLSGGATSDASGMWSRLSPSNPFDILLVLAACGLTAAALRRRRPLWEYAAGLGLLVATLSAARHGVWLLLFLAVPAATAFRGSRLESSRRSGAPAVPAALAVVCVALVGAVFAHRAPQFSAADADAATIARSTKGQVVLAPEPLAESIAAAGAVVWASNPLDAFTPADQAAYLAFLRADATGAGRAFSQSDVVVAVSGTPQARIALASGFTQARVVGRYTLLSRSQ